MPKSDNRSGVEASTPFGAFPVETGFAAAQLPARTMLRMLQAQQSMAVFWLGVGSDWSDLVRRLSHAQAERLMGEQRPGQEGEHPMQHATELARTAWHEYMDMTQRVVERGNKTTRELAALWRVQSDGVRSAMRNGKHLS